ncbi:unnamed protein product [Acanthoscelides obtectus]|nr:unnamed protein product [Acanthoscelides obtectus]CAK1654968.1 Facilitated trehalose transporter Tret1 [Acanthoscelides obtectus]
MNIATGAMVTWSSPVIPKLTTGNYYGRPLTTDETTWMTSLMTLGAAVGTLVSACIADRIGKKKASLVMLAPSVLGYAVISIVRVIGVLYFCRFLAGLSIGGMTTVVPTYTGEIASKEKRGSMLAIVGSSAVLGFLFSYSVGPYVSVLTLNLLIMGLSLLSGTLFMIFASETAYFYILRGDKQGAEAALRRFRSSEEEIKMELLEISIRIREEPQGNIFDLVKSTTVLKSYFVAVMLLVFQNLTGITAVQYYSQPIFDMIGVDIPTELCPIILGCIQYVGGFTALFVYDKFGRKIIMYVTAVVMILAEVPLGVFCYLKDRGDDVSSISFLPLVCLSVFIFFYNLGWGMIPWVIAAEIFPAKLRVTGICAVAFINWIMVFIITKTFDSMVRTFTLGVLFWIFATSCLISIIFVKFMVTETRGKSLEEIQDALKKKATSPK